MPETLNEFHPFKAVAIDLDGTLLSHDLTISDANLAAVDRLDASGMEIILASGRHSVSILPFARQLSAVSWMVSAQGAFASSLDQTTILYENYLPSEKANSIIDIGQSNGYSIIVYAKSGIFCLEEDEWADYYADLACVRPKLTDRETVLTESIFKVAFVGPEERIDGAEDLPGVKRWDLYKVRTLKNLLEFAGRGTSKAHGLTPLLEHLGIEASELAAFGDAPNDVQMFELAGYSVAMNSGWDEAKSAADAVSPDGPQESAFARAVEGFVGLSD